MFLSKENRQLLKEAKKKIIEEEIKRQNLLSKSTDWGALEEFIQEVNANPGLTITVTLNDNTKLELKTTKEKKYSNPLFDERVYQE